MEKLVEELKALVNELETGELGQFTDPNKPALRPRLKGKLLDMAYGVAGNVYDPEVQEAA